MHTTTTTSSRSTSPTPSSTSTSSIPPSALAHALSTSLSAALQSSAQSGSTFHRVTQTTILHSQPRPDADAGVNAEQIAEKIEIAITATREPLLAAAEEVVVKAPVAAVEERVLEMKPKRVVPRRGMSSDYGIGF